MIFLIRRQQVLKILIRLGEYLYDKKYFIQYKNDLDENKHYFG